MSPQGVPFVGFDPANPGNGYVVQFSAETPEQARIMADSVLNHYSRLAREVDRAAEQFRQRHGTDRVCISYPREWRAHHPMLDLWRDAQVCHARLRAMSPWPTDEYGIRVPDRTELLAEWANHIPPVRELPECAEPAHDTRPVRVPEPEPVGVLEGIERAIEWSREYQRRGSPPPWPRTGTWVDDYVRRVPAAGERARRLHEMAEARGWSHRDLYDGPPPDHEEDMGRYHAGRMQLHQFTRSEPSGRDWSPPVLDLEDDGPRRPQSMYFGRITE